MLCYLTLHYIHILHYIDYVIHIDTYDIYIYSIIHSVCIYIYARMVSPTDL